MLSYYKILYNLLGFLLLFIFVTGCADQIVSDCLEPVTTNNLIISQKTTFADIQTQVFDVSCALSGCHGSNSPQANLNLTSGNSYDNLVNVQGFFYTAYKRVEPGNSSNSLIIKALRGDGLLMPPTGGINNDVIDSIAAWIDRGAINN